jgi:TetR/AcrR family transcriptional repressor of mexCD-oprJ operon
MVLTGGMVQGRQIQASVSSAIMDAAARVFAEHGDSASMADVATAAGVGRATLYRYFDSREDLIQALSVAAVEDLERRLTDADLDRVPVPLAIERIFRALVGSGTKFAFVLHDPRHIDREEIDRRIGEPIRSTLRRGVADETLRSDLSVDLLGRFLGGLVQSALRSTRPVDGGVEQVSAALSSFFLRGAANS